MSTRRQDGRVRAPRLALRFALSTGIAVVLAGAGALLVARTTAADDARDDAIGRAGAIASTFSAAALEPSDFATGVDAGRALELSAAATRLTSADVLSVRIWRSDGLLTWSSSGEAAGARHSDPASLVETLDAERAMGVARDGLVDVRVPYAVADGTVPGVVQLELRDEVAAGIAWGTLLPIAGALALALLVLHAVLFPVLRQVVRRLEQRGEDLADTAGELSRTLDEREEAVAALRVREERHRQLFERANDLIATFDIDGRFVEVNARGEAITGYSREELLGRRFLEFVAPEDIQRAHWQRERKLRGLATTTTYEVELVAKDGRHVAMDIASWLLEGDGGEPVGFQAICRDVSERRELEKQLHQSQKMEAIGQLAGGIAHDFNNLLTAIQGYAELMLARIGDPASPLHRDAGEILRAAERASGLTRQLLSFSRRELVHPQVIDLNGLVGDIESLLVRTLGEHVELATALAHELPSVEVDKGQLEQVILNLALNARDAMPAGGRLVIRTMLAELDADYARRHAGVAPGRYVQLTVSDTGEGMAGEVAARAFEPFFTTKPRGQGTGLGLATVYGIVTRAGGHVLLYSEVGRGTAVKVYLPLAAGAAAEAAAPSEGRAVSRGGDETILVVEDEEAVLELSRRVLGVVGYRVICASTGREALELIDAYDGPLDLVLTDVVLPEGSGREVVERLRELRPAVPVVCMSGYTDDVIVRHGVLEGDVPFLEKPFTVERLLRTVRDRLDRAAEGVDETLRAA